MASKRIRKLKKQPYFSTCSSNALSDDRLLERVLCSYHESNDAHDDTIQSVSEIVDKRHKTVVTNGDSIADIWPLVRMYATFHADLITTVSNDVIHDDITALYRLRDIIVPHVALKAQNPKGLKKNIGNKGATSIAECMIATGLFRDVDALLALDSLLTTIQFNSWKVKDSSRRLTVERTYGQFIGIMKSRDESVVRFLLGMTEDEMVSLMSHGLLCSPVIEALSSTGVPSSVDRWTVPERIRFVFLERLHNTALYDSLHNAGLLTMTDADVFRFLKPAADKMERIAPYSGLDMCVDDDVTEYAAEASDYLAENVFRMMLLIGSDHMERLVDFLPSRFDEENRLNVISVDGWIDHTMQCLDIIGGGDGSLTDPVGALSVMESVGEENLHLLLETVNEVHGVYSCLSVLDESKRNDASPKSGDVSNDHASDTPDGGDDMTNEPSSFSTSPVALGKVSGATVRSASLMASLLGRTDSMASNASTIAKLRWLNEASHDFDKGWYWYEWSQYDYEPEPIRKRREHDERIQEKEKVVSAMVNLFNNSELMKEAIKIPYAIWRMGILAGA